MMIIKYITGGSTMPNYQKLYTLLFNRITEAIEQLDQKNYGHARDLLVRAQQDSEECYISEDDDQL